MKRNLSLKYFYRYHRAFIEASNEYLKDTVIQDDLLMNVVDYFTEKWNEKRSNGTSGQIKIFFYKREKKIENMKKQFVFSHVDKQIEFKSYRQTAPQLLKRVHDGKTIYNKRKLHEFIFVIQKFRNKDLRFEIMKENLYTEENEQNFFNVLQNYSLSGLNYEENIFSDEQNLHLILPASYFGHTEILEWLINDKRKDFTVKNQNGESALHLGLI